ncbi:MAG: cell division ATP-binding protein FtsE [Thermoanaerobaculia bacterium]|nr:cell division ATP-binding protein FtsE [Thermoanaerobaculia bacterium]MCZ7652806.1 cell division ATP-binding protein FtsE [Thermoanaerobaculia bacterium]
MIRLHSVSKRYPGGQSALSDVSFDVSRGQFVILTGASGAGKTTLLRLLYREELPSSGQVLVAGRNVGALPARKVPFLRRNIGVVFQNFRLIDRKTVFENIAYLPRLLGHDGARQKRLAVEALRRVGLAHRLQAFPWQLSGGEQQRVAIARALINDPELLLADEPTGNLDPDLARQIVLLLLDCQRRGTTVVMATHDRELIRRIGQRVLTLDRGRLAQDETLPPGDLPASGVAPEVAPE